MKSKTKTKTAVDANKSITASRAVAPEDIHIGDYLTITHVVGQFVKESCDFNGRIEIVHLRYMPDHAGDPLRVKAICLPYVLTKNAFDCNVTIDLRKEQIARLDRTFGDAAFKKTVGKRPNAEKKRKKKHSEK